MGEEMREKATHFEKMVKCAHFFVSSAPLLWVSPKNHLNRLGGRLGGPKPRTLPNSDPNLKFRLGVIYPGLNLGAPLNIR
jgi:hypothetical protein